MRNAYFCAITRVLATCPIRLIFVYHGNHLSRGLDLAAWSHKTAFLGDSLPFCALPILEQPR